jgi:hypothetical protein
MRQALARLTKPYDIEILLALVREPGHESRAIAPTPRAAAAPASPRGSAAARA